VLCEKPLAMNAAEAEEMANAAEHEGVHLMEAFMYRFHPRIRAFVESVQDPLYVHARFGFRLDAPLDFRLVSSLGGGALLDVGCYTVNVAGWILGEPDDVSAKFRRDASSEEAVDMTVTALLHFPAGATASVWASFESPEEQSLMVVERERTQHIERPFSPRDSENPYQLMVESFADSVFENRPVEIPPSESVANMKVLDAIRQAAKGSP
jgi:predicted dehydrogenase